MRIDRTQISLPGAASIALAAHGLSRHGWLVLTERAPVMGVHVAWRLLVGAMRLAVLGALAGEVLGALAFAFGANERWLWLVMMFGAAIGSGAGMWWERIRLIEDHTLLALWVKADFSWLAMAVVDSLGARLRKRPRWSVLPVERIALSDEAIAKGRERFEREWPRMRTWWLSEDGGVWAADARALGIDLETRSADKSIEHKLLRISRLARMRRLGKTPSPFR